MLEFLGILLLAIIAIWLFPFLLAGFALVLAVIAGLCAWLYEALFSNKKDSQ